MSTEQNKAVVRRVFEELNKQNYLVLLEEFCARDYVWHSAPPGISPDLAGTKQLHTALFTAFPDLHWVVDDLIAEGDKVVARLTVHGTHQGEFMGMPPSGKVVTYTGIAICRFAGSKAVEYWSSVDLLGLLQQLGVIPQMAQAGA
jgi:predicted ester cyclase